MKLLMKPLILLAFVAGVAFSSNANEKAARSASDFDLQQERSVINDEIARVTEWTLYKEFGAVKIEYKFQECNSNVQGGFKNLNVVFFRFTNLTKKTIEVSFVKELYFDGECHNCDNLDNPEYQSIVVLGPKEVKEGNCEKREDGLYISANFIKLVQGMSGTQLTNFKLINLETKILK